MKKVTIFSAFLLLSLTSIAYGSYEIMSENEARISIDDNENREMIEDMRRQIDENGFYSTYSENAILLREVANEKANGFIDAAADPYFQKLRASPSEFPTTFAYKGISSVDKNHLLGYAPSATWKYRESNLIWTGVTGFFLDDKFGTCRHVVFDMVSSSGKSKYDPNRTTYEVNKKPTTKSSEGNEQSGYIYSITWSGKKYDKELECSNTKPFDSKMVQDLIAYAKIIDNDLPDTPK